MTPESSMSTPDAPLTTERLDAEVEQIRRHYGDRRGLYDAGQMVAHLDILLAAHARLTAELAEARQFVTRVHQRIQAWSDDPQTRLEAFAITHEQVADLKAEVLKRGQQNTELARLHAEACRKLEQAEAALTELAPLKPAASDAARQLLMGAIAEQELHTGLRPALLAAWRSLKAADVALSPTVQAEATRTADQPCSDSDTTAWHNRHQYRAPLTDTIVWCPGYPVPIAAAADRPVA